MASDNFKGMGYHWTEMSGSNLNLYFDGDWQGTVRYYPIGLMGDAVSGPTPPGWYVWHCRAVRWEHLTDIHTKRQAMAVGGMIIRMEGAQRAA